VTNVWETRSRLFLEELEKLAEWLSSDAPKVPASLEEQTVRLLVMVIMLLRQHRINKRGQCQWCGWTRWAWGFGVDSEDVPFIKHWILAWVRAWMWCGGVFLRAWDDSGV
jgi:hypothetical protein